MRQCGLTLLAALVLVTVGPRVDGPAIVEAAPHLTRAQKKEAKRLFFAGMRAFKQGNYLAAVTQFVASYKIRPKAVVIFNIAMCHRALFRYKRSIAAFEAYRRQARRIRRKRRAVIQRYVKQMTAKLAHIALRVEPAGALIRVDGNHVATAPLVAEITVDPGTRKLEITKEGYQPFVKDLLLQDGQHVRFTVTLERLARWGFVVVSAPVVGALGSVGNAKPRPLPLSVKLREGSHKIRITAPGHKPRTVTVTVVAGKLTKKDVRLQELPRPRRRVEPLVPPRRRVEPPPERPRPRPSSAPFYKRAWFWTVVGAVVVGAGATAGYFIWDGAQPEDHFNDRLQLR